MINRKKLLNTTKEIKRILKELKGKDLDKLKHELENRYERISNRKGFGYENSYNLAEMLQSKTTQKIAKKINREEIVVFELVEYSNAPFGFVIFYNSFKNKEMYELEVYIIKEDAENEE